MYLTLLNLLDFMKTEIRWAAIISVFGLLWGVGEKLFGLHDQYIAQHPTLTMFIAPFIILLYFLALRDKRKTDLGGYMTWPEGTKAGMIISFLVALLALPMEYLLHAFISPDFFDNAIQYALDNKLIDTREKAASYFNLKNYLIQATVGSLSMGIILSAILALLLKKERKKGGQQGWK